MNTYKVWDAETLESAAVTIRAGSPMLAAIKFSENSESIRELVYNELKACVLVRRDKSEFVGSYVIGGRPCETDAIPSARLVNERDLV